MGHAGAGIFTILKRFDPTPMMDTLSVETDELVMTSLHSKTLKDFVAQF